MSATLASLRIRNLALVEDITWEPRPGFTALTGETGAGKSVLLGALNLLLGERGDKSAIRSETDGCAVEAVFDDADNPRLAALLAESGAEPCEDGRLVIKRTLPAEGTGRQFVNGSPVSLALLRALGDQLVDLHGPHDHQSLFSRDQQTRLLDSFAGTVASREEFAAARRNVLALREEQSALEADALSLAREIDLLTHQTAEIEAARPDPDEEDRLVARQHAAQNSRRIGELCAQLEAVASGDDDSLTGRVTSLARLAKELDRLDPTSAPVARSCEILFDAAADLARAVTSYSAALDADPADIPEIEARLDTLQSLKRKYGRTVADVIAFGTNAATRLASLTGRGERRDSLADEIRSAETALRKLGRELSARRREAATQLAARVREGLAGLGFAKSEFFLTLEAHDEPVPHGFETAEFQFAPNPGEPPRPLRAIASSGEISRVMLALKGALAAQDEVPVLVFDEIDANVGGEVAAKVGAKMRELGKTRQVLCITHLPPVAAAASSHFVVTKDVHGERTRTTLAEATGKSREEEIARMLGGKSASALAHARALLNSG